MTQGAYVNFSILGQNTQRNFWNPSNSIPNAMSINIPSFWSALESYLIIHINIRYSIVLTRQIFLDQWTNRRRTTSGWLILTSFYVGPFLYRPLGEIFGKPMHGVYAAAESLVTKNDLAGKRF
jgi:hypothetical protein